ncbi:MAG: large-conductance mechanosensitive channel protein MscL [Planctomycetota bacterium]
MGMIKEFKEFAMRGNVVDMAVGIIIGAAFGKIVSSLVSGVMMPPIGLLLGGVSFSDQKLQLKEGVEGVEASDGVAAVEAVEPVFLEYGVFIDNIINFLIVAFAVFILIKVINKATAAMKEEEEKKEEAPPEPSNEEKLLAEIRDLMAAKNG